jgi:hypothetical protein
VIPKLATAGFAEDQVTMPLTSRVLPSVNVPMAESNVVVWFAMEGFAGTIATETMLEESTFKVALPLDWNVAEMPLAPICCPIAKPLFVVINGGNELQVARLVTSCVVWSLKVATALNCC